MSFRPASAIKFVESFGSTEMDCLKAKQNQTKNQPNKKEIVEQSNGLSIQSKIK